MSTPILATKFYIPPTRPELVPRPRLIERLNEGLSAGCKLTLISAPAGFGKTTLASDWLRQLNVPATWVSLDESDNDPASFLTYFITAFRQINPSIGQAAQAMLQSPPLPPLETLITTLINDILAAFTDTRCVLVLDDYHLIETQPIHDALTFLLDHLPPQMHLVIITRSDPFLPLSRLRAKGHVTDIRADNLRFSLQETTTFLNQVMDLTLSGNQVATLETRTEGWIAGLQLAALALQSPPNLQSQGLPQGTLSGPSQGETTEFISTFSGDDRYIADYLVDEVLVRCPKIL
jgi:LuxR family maltose regulon positive regulatory protein